MTSAARAPPRCAAPDRRRDPRSDRRQRSPALWQARNKFRYARQRKRFLQSRCGNLLTVKDVIPHRRARQCGFCPTRDDVMPAAPLQIAQLMPVDAQGSLIGQKAQQRVDQRTFPAPLCPTSATRRPGGSVKSSGPASGAPSGAVIISPSASICRGWSAGKACSPSADAGVG